MAKMLQLHGFGLNNLQIDDVAPRSLQENEARIKVKAFGITGDNLNYIQGRLLPGQEKPVMPAGFGYEAAGIVEAVGVGVNRKWINKRVAPIGPYDFNKYSSAGSEIIVPADRLWEIPASMSFTEAAVLWVPYLTAFPVHQVKAGSYVLLTAGTSSVAHAAMEYAHLKGATVIGTTRSPQKAQYMQQETPIDQMVVSDSQLPIDQIMELTNGHGIDFIFDPIGGASFNDLLIVAVPAGQIVEYGVLDGIDSQLSLAQLLGKSLTIRGFAVSDLTDNPGALKAAVQIIQAAIQADKIHPLIDSTFTLNQYRQAFQRLKDKNHYGRVVITNNEG